ncbi:phage holin family protein [Bacillus licheniformis]|uniref:phage holin family protein n=1 Tax=Bacillus licheniformis TaxID=1402 RepID=UPI00092AB63D|nr:phage holin family protein [Bacillus licheniformis]MBU8737993.1 phage holin family protein [Bacillus licheniformis]MCY7775513.1 phage holin family protein [Bacillus licheniformis]MCY7953752.1 phage holin family protein [Bacillus licheniformis]MCY8020175.1 phage holin family protein [Bacillus licheniformis]MCY8157282.1 phage holin family protein [Bacillus licheniformis]
MMRWIINVLVNALLLIVIAGYFDAVHVRSIGAAITASLILSILNMFVKPVLVILTLPVTVITLGLFLFIINAITLYMTASIMGDSFDMDGFGTAIFASIVLSVFHLLIQKAIIEPMSRK